MLAYIPYMDPMVYIYIYMSWSAATPTTLALKSAPTTSNIKWLEAPKYRLPRQRRLELCAQGGGCTRAYQTATKLATGWVIGYGWLRQELLGGASPVARFALGASSMHSSVAMASMRRLDLSQSSRSRKSGIRGKQGATFTTGPFILTSSNDFESWSD